MRSIFFCAMAIFALFTLGCTAPEEPIPSEEGPKIEVIGADVPEEQQNDSELMQKALDERDPSYCLKVSPELKEECILPLSNDSFSNCLMLTTYDLKRGCLFHIAYAEDDIAVCDLLIGEDREECIKELSPPCSLIVDDNNRSTCVAMEKQNCTYCLDDDCFFDCAIEHGSTEDCDRILSEPKRAACYGVLNYSDTCSGFVESNRDLCYYKLALGTDNPSYCYPIDGSYALAPLNYDCFYHFAVKEENYNFCAGVGLLERWNCYTNYALYKNDIDACYAIDPRAELSWNMCFDNYARAYWKPSACNPITKPTSYRTACFAYTVLNATSLEYSECIAVIDEAWKDKCFSQMAYLSSNRQICNYVEDLGVRDICYSYFQ